MSPPSDDGGRHAQLSSRPRPNRWLLPVVTATLVLLNRHATTDAFTVPTSQNFRTNAVPTLRLPSEQQQRQQPWSLALGALRHTIGTKPRRSTALSAGRPNTEDEEEWKAVLSAFRMYKAAYSDLKIPQRFVVPSMKPWPKAAWGMRLGKVVMNMRATGKYTSQNPERQEVLNEMGFVWQVRPGAAKSVTLGQVYTALEAYRQTYGNFNVDTTFVVPNAASWPESVRDLPLGKSLASLPAQLEKQTNPKWRERFSALGWPTSLPTIVPPPVVVEPPAWQSRQAVTAADDDEEEDMFPTSLLSTRSPADKNLSANEERFRKVHSSLETYRKVFGDLLVPQPFVVPDSDPQWPQDVWGLRLGARVNAIRSQGTFVNGNPERRQMLDDLGFVWSPPKAERRGRKRMEDGLDDMDSQSTEDSLTELFGGDFGFKDFSLDGGDPSDSPKPSWAFEGGGDLQDLARPPQDEEKEDEYEPERTLAESMDEAIQRALDVGIIEGITESRRVIKGKRERSIPWFNDDFGDDFVFEDVVEALTLYKKFYGDFSNLTKAEDYVIPAPVEITGFLDDDDDTASFDVDASSRAARAIANYGDQGDFGKSDGLISAEYERLQKEVGTITEEAELDTVVEPKKIVDNADWPEHLAGMKLGNIVARIRDGSLEVKHLPDRKKQLDKIKFDWGDDLKFLDVPFEKAMCAMYAYYMIRGDMFVYEDFVMPDEDPWPQVLAGYEIGKAVHRMRELQNFMEAYHPEKVSLLRMLDFVWFPTMALTLDPNEPEMDNELLRLSALGHPDYAKMIDIPMGLPDRIISDGPFYESDNPKHWWRVWHNWDYVKDYWYQQGRRDNAYVLRQNGYPKMADEHEAKYGPGLFQLIEGTLSVIEGGLQSKSIEENRDILSKLSYYRQEMLGCTDIHPEDRDKLLDDFDEHMSKIMKDSNIELVEEEEEEESEESEGDYEYDEFEEEDDDYQYAEEEINVEDELGLDSR
jgi:hypothetical protein